MGTKRQRPSGTWEVRITHPSLPEPHYATRDTEEAADRYIKTIEEALGRGVILPEVLPRSHQPSIPMAYVLRQYLNEVAVAKTDRPMAEWLQENLSVGIEGITVTWTDEWVAGMKTQALAPGTIRKKVECLARAVDWWWRQHTPKGQTAPSNPLRTLPRGYSTYRPGEGPQTRTDVRRDRRLEPGEYESIEKVLQGSRRAGRERAINQGDDAAEFLLLFRLLVHTALRLREAYTLQVRQVRLDLRTIHIPKSKTKTGRARDVPMTKPVHDWLEAAVKGKQPEDRVFPWWGGQDDEESLKKLTARLSARLSWAFTYAGCSGLTAHDLRHEGTCRWMLMQNAQGHWIFRPEEVRRITGHVSVQMFERYLSLRGSDLAARLW